MILTEAQKRQVLLNMVYENDDKFLALAYKMTRPARPKSDICSVPMGNSFLKNNSNSRAQFAYLNGVGKNWLNFMDDVELLHYIDFQNRFYGMLKDAQCTSIIELFKMADKVPFNKYYQKSADCPKLTKKYEIPTHERMTKDKACSPELRQQVLLDTMIKAHNRKAEKGASIKVLSPAIAQEFAIKVKLPTVTQQLMAGKEEKTYAEKSQKLQFAGTVYDVPIYWNGSFYVFADGRPLNKEYRDYISAGELRHEQEITREVEDDDYSYINEVRGVKFEGTLYNDPIYSRRDSHGFIEYCHGDGSALTKQEEALIEAGELKTTDDEMAD